MNRIALNIIAVFAACLFAAGCIAEVSPLVHTAPEVNFPVTEDEISATVGIPVEFRAEVIAGDRLSCAWYIDGVLEASTATFRYVFEKAGSYNVRFEARNGAGTQSREYRVNVSDVLQMSTSVGDSTEIKRIEGSILKVMAIVEKGSNVSHQWFVDGELMSENAFFNTFVLSGKISYDVYYKGNNQAGEYEKRFRVNVLEKPLSIRFSVENEIIMCSSGNTVEIEAIVQGGGSGLVHSWRIDGQEVSTESKFSHVFTGSGSDEYVISYYGENAKGESVEREWSVQFNKVIGDIYQGGIVFAVTDTYIKVLSLTEAESELMWSSETDKMIPGVSDNPDHGWDNNVAIWKLPNFETDYPAFKFCKDLGEGWYIPSRRELSAIYNGLLGKDSTIGEERTNQIIEENGGTPIKLYGVYWSCCQHKTDKSKAWTIKMNGSKDAKSAVKSEVYRVRAIKMISL